MKFMPMPKGREITFFERERIESYLRMKKKKVWIAKTLNRDYSVIKREIKRNSGESMPYTAVNAQEYANRRKHKTNKRKLEKEENIRLKKFVEDGLTKGYSPEEISGRLKKVKIAGIDETISYESIYDYIYNGQGRYGGWYRYLRKKRCERRRHFSRKKNGSKLKFRVSINEREEIVAMKERFGDWETDSIVSSGKSALSVQYERKSMLCKICKCENRTASVFERALRRSIRSLPESLWLTITRDNGTENALHFKTDIPSFFCNPYSPWQKGGVENINGLIREYFPKGSNFDKVTAKEIYAIQERLNNRPRKSLGYLTPNEVIREEIKKGH